MTGQSALILGGTGAVGKELLKELLASPDVVRVGEYGRRVTPLDQIGAGKDKLEQKTIDFEKLEESGLKEGKWDAVYIALGTSKSAAGGAAAFEKIDREYVVNAARAAKTDDPNHAQRVLYVSTYGADSKSSFLYTRSKGLTEEGLASLGYSDTIIFRPGGLRANREKVRPAEKVFGALTGVLNHITPSFEIRVETLAKSMRMAGILGSSALPAVADATKEGKGDTQFTLISNRGAIGLAKTG